ncbi:MAG: carboxypeptidase-like regulatory domain-containing protein, partial [Gemmatimonadetes bacterium]|nr:carboxypeptidase-like regulatory domain-containing protein [Gemmatimonadota bacterium]
MDRLRRAVTWTMAAAATAALNGASSAVPDDPVAESPATLSGFIRDRSDGERLPNATVAVGDRQMGTLSNAEGYYALPGVPPGTWVIAVSYIGYAVHRDTVHLDAGQELRLDVELDPEELRMEAVVVEAEGERVESELSQQTSVVVLPMTSLKKMPAMGEPDLLRSLQLLPGVQTSSDYSSGLYVRGGGPDQTGILLDQVRL